MSRGPADESRAEKDLRRKKNGRDHDDVPMSGEKRTYLSEQHWRATPKRQIPGASRIRR